MLHVYMYMYIYSEENEYGCRISRETSCDLYPHNLKEGSFNPGRRLFEGKYYYYLLYACICKLIGGLQSCGLFLALLSKNAFRAVYAFCTS